MTMMQLINDNALDGLQQVPHNVDCILTEFNEDYFYQDTMKETFKSVLTKLHCLLANNGTMYIQVKVKQIPFVSWLATKCDFVLQNVISVPLLGAKIPCHPSKYIDENLLYFLFFCKKNCYPRYMNPVKHDDSSCNCQYSANWNWFTGTKTDVYRYMIQASTRHSETVLDPFMNAGDIGEAVLLQDRHFIGIEISRARFDDTKARLEALGE